MTVNFDKALHQFTNKISGKIIPSVSQLLKKHRIYPYTDFKTAYMEYRMRMGTYAHEEFEGVEKGTLKPEDMLCDEAPTFRQWYADKLPSRPDAVEYMVVYKGPYDEPIYAGIVDMIYTDADGKKVLVDHKTGEYHEKMVSWQMHLYAMALADEGIEIDRYECWCYKDKTIHDVPFLKFEEFKGLIDAEREGRIYGSGELEAIDSETDNAVSKYELILETWQALETQYKAMKADVEEIKDKLYEYMLSHDIDVAENDRVRLKLTRPSVTHTFDGKAFQKDNPETYKEYTKEGSKKGYVTVTWREGE